MLRCSGFEVIDLGVDVPSEKFVQKIKETESKVVGLSCLLTISFETMKKTVEEIEKETRKLIDKLASGGGFILGSGCEVPADAPLENIRTVIRTARKYEWYK